MSPSLLKRSAWWMVWGGWILVLYLILSGPTVQRIIVRMQLAGSEGQFDIALDPKLRSKIRLPSSDAFGQPIRRLEGNQNLLVVACGPCSECSLNSFDPRTILGGLFGDVVLVYVAEQAEIRDTAGHLSPKFLLVADPDGAITKALNAAWTPRFFLVAPDFSILNLQAPGDKNPRFVSFKEKAR